HEEVVMAMSARRSSSLGMIAALIGGVALVAIGVGLTSRSTQTTRQAPRTAARTAIVGVRLFDGEKVVEDAMVVFEPGSILSVGPRTSVPEGAVVIDGSGRTLLPGLIDAHTHAYGDALARALAFGVTTELDMFSDQEFAARMRREQAEDGAPRRADL